MKSLESRKFQLASFLVFFNTIGYYVGGFLGKTVMSEAGYVTLTSLLVTAYIAGNVYQHVNLSKTTTETVTE